LWAEAERLGSLNVDEPNFKSERDVVKEEYRFRVLAPPYGRLFYAIEKNSFTKHPYRRPGIGSIEELDAATIDDVRAFHQTFYRPDDAVLIVVGDFEQQQLDGWVDQYFTSIAKPDSAIPAVSTQEPARTEEKRVDEYAPNVPLPAVALTWLIPSASHADAIPLSMAATLLSDGESSRLQEKLVRGEISQEVFANADLREDLGLFSIVSIMGSEHQPAEAEKLIRAELAAMGEKPVPAAELEKAKNLIVTSALRERETSNGKAFTLGESLMLQHDPSIVNTGLANVQATTAADIQRVVKKYLIDGKALVLMYLDESAQKKSAVGSRQSAVDEALVASGDGRGLLPTADRRLPTVSVGGAK
jgi:zinc protease